MIQTLCTFLLKLSKNILLIFQKYFFNYKLGLSYIVTEIQITEDKLEEIVKKSSNSIEHLLLNSLKSEI